MKNPVIRIAFRQVIDAKAEGDLEKKIWSSSYDEFLLKSQAYNPDGRFRTFSDLKANDGRANSLHYKTGFAIGHFIEGLDHTVPHIRDNSGKGIRFKVHEFQLIGSDIGDKQAHIVAIIYYSDHLLLLGNFGDFLLLAHPHQAKEKEEDPLDSFLLQLAPGIDIIEYLYGHNSSSDDFEEASGKLWQNKK
jgi:hypothetical protein